MGRLGGEQQAMEPWKLGEDNVEASALNLSVILPPLGH